MTRALSRIALSALTLACLTWTSTGAGAVPPGLDAQEVADRWAGRLSGKSYTATVTFGMKDEGEKRLTIRWDDSQKRERLLVRFEWPEALRGNSFLMLENNDRPNEYYYYSTARSGLGVRRIRRIARGNPFAGGEFDYLHFRVARHGHPVPKAVETDRLDGRDVYVLTEEAENMHFERREIWLDPETFVPLRGEYWRNGEKFLEAETVEIRQIQGIPTPVQIRFHYPARPELAPAVWQVDSIDYERPILDSYFARPR